MPLFFAASVLCYQLLQLFFAFCFILCKFSSVALSCPTLCNPKDCSTSGFPVHHQLPKLTQTHDHWVSEAFQPSHSLLSPSPPAFNLSQIRVFSNESVLRIRWPASASVLPMNIQGWFPLGLTGLISLQSKGFWRVFSSATIRKHQFFGTLPSLWSDSHIHTWLLEKS